MEKGMSELRLQSSCYQKFWNKYPEYRRCLFSVPNGGTRNKVEAMSLKASGLVPGVPDMIFLCRGKAYGLEFKTENGRLSDEQWKVHAAWMQNGVTVHVIRSEVQFWAVMDYIIKSN